PWTEPRGQRISFIDAKRPARGGAEARLRVRGGDRLVESRPPACQLWEVLVIRRPCCALLLLLIASAALAGAAFASDCTRDSTGMVPLIDLGAGFYEGAQGGLYPGGSNRRPTAHNAAGVSIAEALSP